MNQKYILLFNTNTQQMAEHLLYILVVNIIHTSAADDPSVSQSVYTITEKAIKFCRGS